MTNANTRVFKLTVTLLEDLHTGSGMGSAVVDRLLARDPGGTPIIAAEHVKGVWRDNALRLKKLDHIDQALIDALFGTESGQRGYLQAPELRPTVKDVGTLFWDATARKAGERAPDDHSLRRSEYLPAGLVLTGQGQLNSADQALADALALIVQFTNALGSERTRGSGLITAKLDWLGAGQATAAAPFGPPAAPAPYLSAGVRLLLRAEAPVCIPTTGAPGNIIPSEHHIPGRTLFGAIARACIDAGTKPAELFQRKLAIGPGYPLPAAVACADATALADIEVLPMPLNLWSPKPGLRQESPWPHWLPQSKKQQQHQQPVDDFRDMLIPLDEQERDQSWEAGKTRYKRPRDNAYLFRQGTDQWQAFESRLGLRMRNRRGDPVRQDVKASETALFTVEQMPTGTCFIADIRPLKTADQAAVQTLVHLLGLDANASPVTLRVGRGGAPVSIQGWCPLAGNGPGGGTQQTGQSLRVTLLTDLIARAPDLRFHAKLAVGALRDALGQRGQGSEPAATRTRDYSDSVPYRSFNAAAGLPAASRIAIRRGSVLQVEGPAAAALATALASCDAIGEQTWEGNGRFALDLDIDAETVVRFEQTAPRQRQRIDPAGTDRVIRAAKALVEDGKAVKWLPSRAQLGNLRGWLADIPREQTKSDFNQRLAAFQKEVGNRRAGSEWREAFEQKGFIEKLLATCCDGDTCRTEDAELFLRVLTLHKPDQDDGTTKEQDQ
jgi:hypothetical protein